MSAIVVPQLPAPLPPAICNLTEAQVLVKQQAGPKMDHLQDNPRRQCTNWLKSCTVITWLSVWDPPSRCQPHSQRQPVPANAGSLPLCPPAVSYRHRQQRQFQSLSAIFSHRHNASSSDASSGRC
ncbi:hypothetical protein AAFF_G00308470 [Aldrovandia affinis]|uniref:Uncharacterized protein n=1 Tax=Aldrovandia affinis TaxID=143900 RepID=A0AAD7WRS5_9TELE|nr:hypothetical protein AAFF_G00308470 [Aldrovandia affinis]